MHTVSAKNQGCKTKHFARHVLLDAVCLRFKDVRDPGLGFAFSATVVCVVSW